MRPATAVLFALLVVGAGCVGSGQAPGTDPTTDTTAPAPGTTTHSSSSPTSTPATATPLPDRTVDFPDGPKDRPDRPAELTAETVRSFVKTFEYRRVYNELWYGEATEVDLTCEVHSVRNRSTHYVVVVSCTGYSTTKGTATGNGTPTAVHADWFTQYYRYYVDEDSLLRDRAEREGE